MFDHTDIGSYYKKTKTITELSKQEGKQMFQGQEIT